MRTKPELRLRIDERLSIGGALADHPLRVSARGLWRWLIGADDWRQLLRLDLDDEPHDLIDIFE